MNCIPAEAAAVSSDGRSGRGPGNSNAAASKKHQGAEKGVARLPQRVKVAIVGGGAAGLQCAQTLLQQRSKREGRRCCFAEDIVVLEARDRIGGRIHTTVEKRARIRFPPSDRENQEEEEDPASDNDHQQHHKAEAGASPDAAADVVEFCLDHGGAWVHGTGYDWTTTISNTHPKEAPVPKLSPLMELLRQWGTEGPTTDSNSDNDERVLEKHLRPVFAVGNPWIRPKTALHDEGGIALFVAGQRLSPRADGTVIDHALNRHFAILQGVSELGQDMFQRGQGMDTVTTSLQEAIDSVLQKNGTEFHSRLSELSTTDQEITLALAPFYKHLAEIWYGTSTSNLPLCEYVEEEAFSSETDIENWDRDFNEEGGFYGPHCTLKRGMKVILDPLLGTGVSERVFLNEPVTKISLPPDHDKTPNDLVVLSTSSGSKVHADCCVVTMPIGCLKEAIAPNQKQFFEPELSADKRESIRSIDMGHYKKVFMTFDRIFWPREEAFLGMVRRLTAPGDDHDNYPLGNYLLVDNLWAQNGIPCLEAVLSGSSGAWAFDKSDSVIRDAVLDFIEDAMGLQDEHIRTLVTDCHVTRWEEDPYCRGAYSNVTIGCLARHINELQKPEWNGRLVFAGEASSLEFEGSVHGALFSGNRAAELVMACLDGELAHGNTRSGALGAGEQQSVDDDLPNDARRPLVEREVPLSEQ